MCAILKSVLHVHVHNVYDPFLSGNVRHDEMPTLGSEKSLESKCKYHFLQVTVKMMLSLPLDKVF